MSQKSGEMDRHYFLRERKNQHTGAHHQSHGGTHHNTAPTALRYFFPAVPFVIIVIGLYTSCYRNNLCDVLHSNNIIIIIIIFFFFGSQCCFYILEAYSYHLRCPSASCIRSIGSRFYSYGTCLTTTETSSSTFATKIQS